MLCILIHKEKESRFLLEGTSSFKADGITLTFLFQKEHWYLKVPHDMTVNDPLLQEDKPAVITGNAETWTLYCYGQEKEEVRYFSACPASIGSALTDDITIFSSHIPSKAIMIDPKKQIFYAESDAVFLNHEKINGSHSYKAGDHLTMLQFHLIFGPGFYVLFMRADIVSGLVPYHVLPAAKPLVPVVFHQEKHFFFPSEKKYEMEVSMPLKENGNGQNHGSYGSSILMACASLSAGMIMFYQAYINGQQLTTASISLLLPAVMLANASVIPLITGKKEKKKAEQIRKAEEKKLLAGFEADFKAKAAEMEADLQKTEQYFPPSSLIQTDLVYQQRSFLRIGTIQEKLSVHFSRDTNTSCRQKAEEFLQKNEKEYAFPYLFNPMNYDHIVLQGEKKESLFLALLCQAGRYRDDVSLLCRKEYSRNYPFILLLPGLRTREGKRRIFHQYQKMDAEGLLFAEGEDPDRSGSCISYASLCPDLIIDTDHHLVIDLKAGYRKEVKPEYLQDIPAGNRAMQALEADMKPFSFFDLFDKGKLSVGLIQHAWLRNEEDGHLYARLGKDENSNLLTLDLSEKGQGPHGLIAGTTGSGKSELIATLLLALMCTYPPSRLQIVCLDFKGGGLGRMLEKEGVPHIAGVLSNLDQKQMKRALASIEIECEKRQKLFLKLSEESGCIVNDLDTYRRMQKLYPAFENMPSLLICVDEFAELKKKADDLLQQLVSLARIGRSLGIHLILATQKPAGIINDQIWSNARFKICLKVGSRQDSMEVLHDPGAAGLKHPGEFYLADDGGVHYGKAAFSGYDQKETGKAFLLNEQAERIGKAEHGNMSEAVQTARLLSQAESRKAAPLWKPELEEVFFPALIQHNAYGQADDIRTCSQPYLSLKEGKDCFCILSPSLEEKENFINVLTGIHHFTKERGELFIIDDLHPSSASLWHQDAGINGVFSSDAPAVHYLWKHLNERSRTAKTILIDDSAVFLKRHPDDLRKILDRHLELHVSVILFVSAARAMPYALLNSFARRLVLACDNPEEISSFLDHSVKETIGGKDAFLYQYRHELMAGKTAWLSDAELRRCACMIRNKSFVLPDPSSLLKEGDAHTIGVLIESCKIVSDQMKLRVMYINAADQKKCEGRHPILKKLEAVYKEHNREADFDVIYSPACAEHLYLHLKHLYPQSWLVSMQGRLKEILLAGGEEET